MSSDTLEELSRSLAESSLEESGNSSRQRSSNGMNLMQISSSASSSSRRRSLDPEAAPGELVLYDNANAMRNKVEAMGRRIFGNDFYDLEYEDLYTRYMEGDLEKRTWDKDEYRRAREERVREERSVAREPSPGGTWAGQVPRTTSTEPPRKRRRLQGGNFRCFDCQRVFTCVAREIRWRCRLRIRCNRLRR